MSDSEPADPVPAEPLVDVPDAVAARARDGLVVPAPSDAVADRLVRALLLDALGVELADVLVEPLEALDRDDDPLDRVDEVPVRDEDELVRDEDDPDVVDRLEEELEVPVVPLVAVELDRPAELSFVEESSCRAGDHWSALGSPSSRLAT